MSTKCFWKGTETLVDLSVRKTYELDPKQFELRNPGWEGFVQGLVVSVVHELAIPSLPGTIRADLYKLLLYDEGAFFKPHQDSEKVPGMFGTLIICLSSSHQGGELVLSHNGESMTWKTSDFADFDMSHAVWYPDVFHEIKPITSGHRLVLTYSLIKPANVKLSIPKSVSSYKAEMVNILRRWQSLTTTPESEESLFVVHQLAFQYTQASLKRNALKGKDLLQVDCRTNACSELGFGIYLGATEKEERRDDYSEYEIDSTLSLQYVVDLDGRDVSGAMSLDLEQFLEEEPWEDRDADDRENTGYTGNAGSEEVLWYRDSVVLIVPASCKLDFLYKAEPRSYAAALDHLRNLRTRSGADAIARDELERLCKLIIKARFEQSHSTLSWPYSPTSTDVLTRTTCLQEAVDTALTSGESIFSKKLSQA